MRKQYTYKPVALRFRRWSRKRYAAFISIQHAVTIGQLSANVSERFQAKNGSVHTSVLTFDKVNGNVNFLNEDRRISLLGMSNNVNQQNFSQEDLAVIWSMPNGMPNGGR